jgi:hypothetical protein
VTLVFSRLAHLSLLERHQLKEESKFEIDLDVIASAED